MYKSKSARTDRNEVGDELKDEQTCARVILSVTATASDPIPHLMICSSFSFKT